MSPDFDSFDTETLNRPGAGYAVLLVNGRGLYHEFPKSFAECFTFLRGGRYTCWNMDFDARAICHEKFIPWPVLERLALYGGANWEGYSFRYIPKKFLRVSRGKDHFELFDLAQFYGCSLRFACEKFLPQDAQKETIPEPWYGEIDKCLLDARRPRIIAYALRDAKSTKALTDLLLNSYAQAGIVASNLTSPASLAKSFFGPKLDDHILLPRSANRRFQDSLFGGRVEISEVGSVGPCRLYDIHSAYPSAMVDLPSLAGLDYLEQSRPGKPSPLVAYGRYDISVSVDRSWHWGPLAVDHAGIVEYPVGKFRTICGLSGIKALSRHKIPHEILRSFELIGTPKCYPFRADVPTMYLKRKDPVLGLAMKLTLNSGFGMLCEQQEIFREDGTSFKSRNVNGNFIRTSGVLGSFNCFPMAAAITESTRIRIWEVMHKFGSLVKMSATDSILLDAGSELETGDALGEWGLKGAYDDTIILGCGRYILRRGNSDAEIHLRGFELSARSVAKLRSCQRRSTNLPLFTAGSLRQWALGGCLDDLNVLDHVQRRFTLADQKRHWLGSFEKIADAFTGNIKSEPWNAC